MLVNHETTNNELVKQILDFARDKNVSDSAKSEAFALANRELQRRKDTILGGLAFFTFVAALAILVKPRR